MYCMKICKFFLQSVLLCHPFSVPSCCWFPQSSLDVHPSYFHVDFSLSKLYLVFSMAFICFILKLISCSPCFLVFTVVSLRLVFSQEKACRLAVHHTNGNPSALPHLWPLLMSWSTCWYLLFVVILVRMLHHSLLNSRIDLFFISSLSSTTVSQNICNK